MRNLTGGKGVDVVMDAVGKDTFDGSLNSLKSLGMMISFGNASGAVPSFDVGILGKKGSLKITRPTLFTHIADHETCQEMAKNLANKVLLGDVKINIGQRFALRDVAKAHEALERVKQQAVPCWKSKFNFGSSHRLYLLIVSTERRKFVTDALGGGILKRTLTATFVSYRRSMCWMWSSVECLGGLRDATPAQLNGKWKNAADLSTLCYLKYT